MPRRLLLACFAFTVMLALRCAHAQTDPLFTATPQQLACVKVVIAQQAAWNAGDLEAFLAHFKDAPDTKAVLGSVAEGTANVRSAFHLNFPDRAALGNIEYTDVTARELGTEFTLVTAKYKLTRSRKGGGDATGTLTEVLEKAPAGWQIVFFETT
jgi:uncharacterized protein (TIGR02246 family)